MKIFIPIKVFLLCFLAVFNSNKSNVENIQLDSPHRLIILVLPPYDEIANAGISPNVRVLIEENIKHKDFSVLPFPFKKLMGVSYHNVFEKKFCKPILQKIKPDIIIMSKIDQVSGSGNLEDDKWNLRVRIYNVSKDQQINSDVKGNNLNPIELENFLLKNKGKLITEIKTAANRR